MTDAAFDKWLEAALDIQDPWTVLPSKEDTKKISMAIRAMWKDEIEQSPQNTSDISPYISFYR